MLAFYFFTKNNQHKVMCSNFELLLNIVVEFEFNYNIFAERVVNKMIISLANIEKTIALTFTIMTKIKGRKTLFLSCFYQ